MAIEDYSSIIFSLLIITGILSIIYKSFNHQKSFSNKTKPDKLLVFQLSTMFLIVTSIIILVIFDLFSIRTDIHDIKEAKLNDNSVLSLSNNSNLNSTNKENYNLRVEAHNKHILDFSKNNSINNHLIKTLNSTLSNSNKDEASIIKNSTKSNSIKSFRAKNEENKMTSDSIEYNNAKEESKYEPLDIDYINISLSIINLTFFIILPYPFFITLESIKQSNSNFFNFFNDNEEEADDSQSGINTSEDLNETKRFQSFKNYFYYLVILLSMNIIYYIRFVINKNSSQKNLVHYSVVPYNLKSISYINSIVEILNYSNLEVLLIIGKVLFVMYVPYGLSLLITKAINSFKNPIKARKAYKSNNLDINKNYETIKKITSEKIMVGIPLTKKEKQQLKEAKSKIDILDHKQEFLENKVSTWETIKLYCSFPLKFIGVFVLVLGILFFVISKMVICYNTIFNSICGSECGYLVTSYKSGFSLQDSFFGLLSDYNHNYNPTNFNSFTDYFLYNVKFFIEGSGKYLFFIIAFYAVVVFTSFNEAIKDLGLIIVVPFKIEYYNEESIKSSRFLNFLMYMTFAIISLVGFYEIILAFPEFMNFGYEASKCSLMLSGFTSDLCQISHIGVVSLKLKLNFSILSISNILFEIIFIVLSMIFVVYYPMKALIKLNNELDNKGLKRSNFNKKDKYNETIDEVEEEHLMA